jgi:hypothetical protein
MMRNILALCVLLGVAFAQVALADYYSCPKKVYSEGWLRKYDYKGETWAADTHKGGAFVSTSHVSTESTTSSVDPGVSTGEMISSSQYTSSWGECAMIDQVIAMNMREDYIDQNLGEIKKEIAQGTGYHIDSLANLSGCSDAAAVTWAEALQAHTGEFYDSADGHAFVKVLNNVIHGNSALSSACQMST